MHRHDNRHGFTMVELIIAVSVIAVLASLLTPVVIMARKNATKVECMSNQRQLAMAILGYADEYRGIVPLAWPAEGTKQGNYYIRKGGKWAGGFGMLYVAGVLDTQKAYYCPAQTIPDHMMGGPGNAWPPETGSKCRTSYTLRPELAYTWDGPNPKMPVLDNYSSFSAFSSCLVSTVQRVDKAHDTGVVAGYADGHVAWVQRNRFEDTLNKLGNKHSSSRNQHMDQLFVDLDNAANP